MHEFSVSSEIVRTVLDSVGKNKGKRVLSVQLEIGELTLLNVDQVVFWIDELFKGSIAEGAKLKVKTVKTHIQCRACGYRGRLIPHQDDPSQHYVSSSCPKCGSFQIKIERGRECILRKIQAVK